MKQHGVKPTFQPVEVHSCIKQPLVTKVTFWQRLWGKEPQTLYNATLWVTFNEPLLPGDLLSTTHEGQSIPFHIIAKDDNSGYILASMNAQPNPIEGISTETTFHHAGMAFIEKP